MKAFKNLDTENRGYLTVEQLVQASKVLGMNFSEEEIKETMKEFDQNENGRLDFNEFENLINVFQNK